MIPAKLIKIQNVEESDKSCKTNVNKLAFNKYMRNESDTGHSRYGLTHPIQLVTTMMIVPLLLNDELHA